MFDELQDVNEVLFFTEGICEVGYELNGIVRIVVKLKRPNGLGSYGATFNKRSQFVYRTQTQCTGYFIRKVNWKKILDENSFVSNELKSQILRIYETRFRGKINLAKKLEIRKLRKRADQ